MSEAQLTVNELTPGELEGLQAAGRIKDGVVLPDPSAPTGPVKPPTGPLPADQIPEMPAGVAERIKAAKELQSSFIHTEGSKVIRKSDDGGAAANEKAAAANPDWPGKPPEDPVEAEDKMKFLAAMLGAERFAKEYPLFGGAIRVRFQTLTDAENDACAKQSFLDDKIDPLVSPNSQSAFQVRMQRCQDYQFAGMLGALLMPGQPPRVFEPWAAKENVVAHVTPIKAHYVDLQATTPAPMMNALRNAFMRFLKLVVVLQESAEKPDFWSPASGS